MEYTKEKVRELLKDMAEPDYAKFSGSLLGREAVMLGVRLPKIRELAKTIAKTEGRAYLDHALRDAGGKEGALQGEIAEEPGKESMFRGENAEGPGKESVFRGENAEGLGKESAPQGESVEEPEKEAVTGTEEPVQYMEELMLYGMVIGCMKEKLDGLFPYIERYVARIDNWSLCDSFCAGLKQTKKQPKAMWEFLQPYLRSEKEFDLRFGVVMLMDFYVTPEYIDRLLQIFDGIRHEGYYVKMAVAWALSVCLVKQWDKSFAYMASEDNHLDEFTFGKTVQKCRESYRLTDRQKQDLTALKEKHLQAGGKKQAGFGGRVRGGKKAQAG